MMATRVVLRSHTPDVMRPSVRTRDGKRSAIFDHQRGPWVFAGEIGRDGIIRLVVRRVAREHPILVRGDTHTGKPSHAGVVFAGRHGVGRGCGIGRVVD